MTVEIYSNNSEQQTMVGNPVQFVADDSSPVDNFTASVDPSLNGVSSVQVTNNGRVTTAPLGRTLYAGTANITDGLITATYDGQLYNPSEIPADLNSIILANTEEKTASGDIASFNCQLGEYPVKDLTVGIEPVQDLHGYDYPWPSGGNVNLIPDGTDTNNGYVYHKYVKLDGTYGNSSNGYVCEYFEVSAGSYTVDVKNRDLSPIICFYDENKTFLSSINPNKSLLPYTFTLPAGTKYIRTNQYVKASENIVQIQSGSQASAVVPYSNICAISGWTGCNISNTKKNFLNPNDPDYDRYNYDSDGSFVTNSKRIASGYIPVNEGETYIASTASPPVETGFGFVEFACFDAKKSFVKIVYANSIPSISYTVESGISFIRFCVEISTELSALTPSVFETYKMQFEHGSVATAYEPYSGTTIPISWQSSAGTVYGGTLDVTSGVLTVTDANIASYNGETLPGEWISDRDVYAAGTTPTTGAQVVYKLATPQSYQLTPQEVTTLLGQNNIWSDTGSSTVEYRDGRINETPVLTESNALISGEQATYPLALPIILSGNRTPIYTYPGENNMSANVNSFSVTWSKHWFDITPWIAWQGLTFSRNDVDAPNAGRDMSGYMHRGRVAVKEKMNINTIPLTRAKSAKLQTLLYPETIMVRVNPYPRTNYSQTLNMYSNNVKVSYMLHKENGEDLETLSFPLIEN